MANRLHVDHPLPVEASRVLHLGIGCDGGGEYRGSQLEPPLKGGVQVDVGRCISGVRIQFEQRVDRLIREVDC